MFTEPPSSVVAGILAAIVLQVAGGGASFGYHFAARAAGVDIVQTMRDDIASWGERPTQSP